MRYMFLIAMMLSMVSIVHAQDAKPTLWLVGDSTVKNDDKAKGQMGWGNQIGQYIDQEKITLKNHAIAGRSSRSYTREGRWDAIMKDLKAGDFVIIQLGTNDQGNINDPKGRAALAGTGDETKESSRTDPEGKTLVETVHTYGWYIRQFVIGAKSKGATPIICSLVPHCPKPGSTIDPEKLEGGTRLWAQQVAEQEKVPYIELYGIIWSKYAKMTPEAVKKNLFCAVDNTHTSEAGAKLNAECVIEGIRGLKDVPLAQYLAPEAK